MSESGNDRVAMTIFAFEVIFSLFMRKHAQACASNEYREIKCRRKLWSVDRNLWTEVVDRRRK